MKKNLIFWLFALLLLTACGSSEATQQTGDTAQASQITVYKSPTWGCCGDWSDYMAENGYQVQEEDVNNLPEV